MTSSIVQWQHDHLKKKKRKKKKSHSQEAHVYIIVEKHCTDRSVCLTLSTAYILHVIQVHEFEDIIRKKERSV